jgi:hypothetical protein
VTADALTTRDHWNASRFRPGDRGGFYESYFQRANHPRRPLAFWIRYTAFCPRGRPHDARGELWAIYFDGEARSIVAVKEAVPMADCAFSPVGLDVRIGRATLTDRGLVGWTTSESHSVEWALKYRGDESPLLLLPEAYYERAFPKAKALVGTPNASYRGTLSVDGRAIEIDGWVGSQNHNWGTRHTDRYAWGQVAGFDDAPDSFLECSTAQVRIGPFWSPRLTFLVLRDEGAEMALNGMGQAVRASGRSSGFRWRFDTRRRDLRISGCIEAPAGSFVGLRYANPPGGEKTCLNTKLASARISVERRGRPPRTLTTRDRAAFEILADSGDDLVPVVL